MSLPRFLGPCFVLVLAGCGETGAPVSFGDAASGDAAHHHEHGGGSAAGGATSGAIGHGGSVASGGAGTGGAALGGAGGAGTGGAATGGASTGGAGTGGAGAMGGMGGAANGGAGTGGAGTGGAGAMGGMGGAATGGAGGMGQGGAGSGGSGGAGGTGGSGGSGGGGGHASCPDTGTVAYDGTIYDTVQIGSQCWLKSNLDAGTMIDQSERQTNNAKLEKWCHNDDEAMCGKYGGLYEFKEMMAYSYAIEHHQGICPPGWQVPSRSKWRELSDYLGDDYLTKMKVGPEHDPPWNGTNESGFSAIAAGHEDGSLVDYATFYWLPQSVPGREAHNLNWTSGIDHFQSTNLWHSYGFGFSVRCMKDSQPQ